MSPDVPHGQRERAALIALAVVGFACVNGLFLYGLTIPGALRQALSNPIALAFVIEAFLMLGALTWLLGRWGVRRIPAGWFIVLALAGGLAFAVPVALLWRRGSAER